MGKTCRSWQAPRKRCPYRSARRALIAAALFAAAWILRMRCPMTAHTAASYGEWKHTGRSPGYSAMSRETTGSPTASPGKPLPSTSSERMRAS
ncbi:hypothetical protein ADK86_31325 [Streptomyces sp. NRRL F-5755]|nr:hypothetical protein ADK86_31325 [Streptomyces sp. NRRL F-5755]